MSVRVTGLKIWIHVDFKRGASPLLLIDYTLIGTSNSGPSHEIKEYGAQFETSFNDLSPELRAKLTRLGDYCYGNVQAPEIDLGDFKHQGTVSPWS